MTFSIITLIVYLAIIVVSYLVFQRWLRIDTKKDRLAWPTAAIAALAAISIPTVVVTVISVIINFLLLLL